MRGLIRILLFAVAASSLAAPVGPDGTLQVELLRYPDERSVFHHNPVIVRFTNTHNRTIKILRPLDGSEWGWHIPHYRFTVSDSSGKAVELDGRCGISGLWANIKWPDDYIIQILPGDSYEMQVGIPHAIPADGDYRVTFEYVYDPKTVSKAQIVYPDGLWSGTARAKDITLRLKK